MAKTKEQQKFGNYAVHIVRKGDTFEVSFEPKRWDWGRGGMENGAYSLYGVEATVVLDARTHAIRYILVPQ